MKLLIAFCALSMTSTAMASEGLVTFADKATEMAIAVTKSDYKDLSKKLQVQVISVKEKGEVVKVELAVGSKEQPARLQNCVTVTFDETGFVKQIQQQIDAETCE